MFVVDSSEAQGHPENSKQNKIISIFCVYKQKTKYNECISAKMPKEENERMDSSFSLYREQNRFLCLPAVVFMGNQYMYAAYVYSTNEYICKIRCDVTVICPFLHSMVSVTTISDDLKCAFCTLHSAQHSNHRVIFHCRFFIISFVAACVYFCIYKDILRLLFFRLRLIRSNYIVDDENKNFIN